ncbi:MAG: transaldolase [Saprospiraceae bacterium]|jgi:transaldolase
MELYLDSVNLEEIKAANKLGFLTGLTTTPTFMIREGVKDIDAQILKTSKYVNILQVEALGDNAEQIIEEANRLIGIGLSKDTTVFKIPISLEGVKACKSLVDKGFQVNLHLVYTVQQAYMAFAAGATYVCPLVGRLQDEGHDALGLVKQCVDITKQYNYKSKIMFSSVRNVEHVKNALNIGVHTITVPWKIIQKLTENHFTRIGTDQFIEDTKALTKTVGDFVISENVSIASTAKITDALFLMTQSKLGAVAIMNSDNSFRRIFTDGDLRRLIQDKENNILNMSLESLGEKAPIAVDSNCTLYDVRKIFHANSVDTLVVMNGNDFLGLIDIHHAV